MSLARRVIESVLALNPSERNKYDYNTKIIKALKPVLDNPNISPEKKKQVREQIARYQKAKKDLLARYKNKNEAAFDMAKELLKYAKEDVAIAKKEGSMAVADTKIGAIFIDYNKDNKTFYVTANRKGQIGKEILKDASEKEVVDLLISSYQVIEEALTQEIHEVKDKQEKISKIKELIAKIEDSKKNAEEKLKKARENDHDSIDFWFDRVKMYTQDIKDNKEFLAEVQRMDDDGPSKKNEGVDDLGRGDSKNIYFVKVNGVDPKFFEKPFGQQVDDLAKIRKFKNDADKFQVGYGGNGSVKASIELKKWLKEKNPSEFYSSFSKSGTESSLTIYAKGVKSDEPKNEGLLLATSGSPAGIIKMIEQFWYSKAGSVELKEVGPNKWSVWQSGKEMTDVEVVKEGKRYKFQGKSKTNEEVSQKAAGCKNYDDSTDTCKDVSESAKIEKISGKKQLITDTPLLANVSNQRLKQLDTVDLYRLIKSTLNDVVGFDDSVHYNLKNIFTEAQMQELLKWIVPELESMEKSNGGQGAYYKKLTDLFNEITDALDTNESFKGVNESAKEGVFKLYGKSYKTKVFKSDDEANKFLEDNEEYSVIGTKGEEGKDSYEVHIALTDDVGESLKLSKKAKGLAKKL